MKIFFRQLLLLLLGVVSAASLRAQTGNGTLMAEQRDAQIRALRQELTAISARLSALETEGNPHSINSTLRKDSNPQTQDFVAQSPAPPPVALKPEDVTNLAFLRGTTLNFGVDGYYGYNFNQPIGRVNLLRAYDVSSNSFSLNQVNFIVEHLPSTEQRFGGRIDLQFGQATEALQGSSVNEQRPQVWRNLFQAYGSYLAPIGSGLQVDFGKWASALGNEGNYTKDQIAYSRAYSFNYLPFYHMGLRANYNLTPKVNVAYWLVNGANDTEDLNGFKSQAFLLTLKPATTLSWNVNYYFGQESRDVTPNLNQGPPAAPTQSCLPAANIMPAPNGREHILDTYAMWNATRKLTLVGEADFVINRTYSHNKPERVFIGEFAGRYALSSRWNIGARTEYFDDRGGLFSGKIQALKEVTLVVDHSFASGFLMRAEYRRDFSNQRYFLTDTPAMLSHSQTTAEVGLIYWWGTKKGSW
jgi:hypothetical protein